MNKQLKLLKGLSLLLAVLILTSANILKADDIDAPENLKGLINNPGFEGLYLSWQHKDTNNIKGYKIYKADKITEDTDDFELLETADFGDQNIRFKGKFFSYYLYYILHEENTFYITAYNDQQESEISNFLKIKRNNMQQWVRFTTTPPVSAGLGEEYHYKPEIKSNKDYQKAKFSVLDNQTVPDDLELDSETGEITFTAEEEGDVHFNLSVSIYDEDQVLLANAMQQIRVSVSECDELAEIEIEIKDEEGENVQRGIAILQQAPNNQDSTGYPPEEGAMLHKQFEDGEVKFEDVDKGSYYLIVQAEGYQPQWYKDADNPWDAETIEVDCGSDISLEVILKEFTEPERYSVSGYVKDNESGEAIPNAFVELYIKNGEQERPVNIMGTTNSAGLYTIEGIPSEMTFYMRAHTGMVFFDEDSSDKHRYLPQYWDHASQFSEAQEITLTGDIENINFDLKKMPVTETTISGNVSGENDETISDAFVIAFLVSSDPEYDSEIFMGRTVQNTEAGFSLQNLIPGDYVLLAIDPKFDFLPGYYSENSIATMRWSEATRINVQEDEKINDINIQLRSRKPMHGGGIIKGYISEDPGGNIEGSNSSSSGDAVNGANIYLTNGEGATYNAVQSNQDGSFTLSNVPNGSYLMVIDKIGYKTVKKPVSVDDNNPVAQVEITLEPDLTSVEDNVFDTNRDVNLFPNPAADNLNISFNAYDNNITIKLTDILGNTLITKDISTVTGLNTRQIDVSELAPGTYIVNIYSGGKTNSVPVIVK